MKFVIVCAVGRSGSTLLQGILNAIPGYCIRGENRNFVGKLYDAYRSLNYSQATARKVQNTSPTHPFYGVEALDPDSFISHIRSVIVAQLSPRPDTRVLGFKEISWLKADLGSATLRGYLGFLEQVFPGLKFVFLTRNPDEIAQSQWWAERNAGDVKADIEEFYLLMRHSGANFFEIDYAAMVHDRNALKNLFAFLDEPFNPTDIEKVLATKHSY